MEMAIRPKNNQAALADVAQSPPLYSICKELTAAAQEWRTRAKLHLACNEKA
jgi:hypothetical protein